MMAWVSWEGTCAHRFGGAAKAVPWCLMPLCFAVCLYYAHMRQLWLANHACAL